MAPPGPRLVSVRFDVDRIDPLKVFAATSGERSYWERPLDALAIAGVGRCWPGPDFEATSPEGQSERIRSLSQTHLQVGSVGPVSLLGGIPFQVKPTVNPYFVVPDITIETSMQTTRATLSVLAAEESDLDRFDALIAQFDQLLPFDITRCGEVPLSVSTIDVTTREHWDQTIGKALESISRGKLCKVVIGRRQDLTFESNLDPATILQRLRTAYPDTCLFALSDTAGCCFLGASPERLVSLDRRTVRVDCLAGSMPRADNKRTDAQMASALLHDDKNRREHDWVVTSVTSTLRPLCSDLWIDDQPGVRSVRNIHHLITPLEATLKSSEVSALDLALLLNPTSAMAGQPRDVAMDFIASNEGFDRGLYAGAVGWIDMEGNGDLAVGIRSMLVHGNTAHLYAGCGIVEGSDPQAEWNETEWKLIPARTCLGLD